MANKVIWKGDVFVEKLKASISVSLPSLGDALKNKIAALAPVDTGAYRRSLEVSTVSNNGDSQSISVGSSMQVSGHLLGEILEYGTRRSKPQPHYRPALDSASDDAESFISKVRKEIN